MEQVGKNSAPNSLYQQRLEKGEQGGASLGLQGVFGEHGEQHDAKEDQIQIGVAFFGRKPRIQQDEQKKRQAYQAEGHGNGQVLVVGTKTELLLQRGTYLAIRRAEGLRHIACAHPKPRMLPDEMERSPRELNPLSQGAAIGVVETTVEVVFKQGSGKAGM